jgi:hypothetical protein
MFVETVGGPWPFSKKMSRPMRGGSTVTCNCEAMECCHIYCELNTVTCDCGAILLCSHIYCSPRDGISFVEDRIFVGTVERSLAIQ